MHFINALCHKPRFVEICHRSTVNACSHTRRSSYEIVLICKHNRIPQTCLGDFATTSVPTVVHVTTTKTIQNIFCS